MAQWRGQFTDLTHVSKVADREEQLRCAVATFHLSNQPDGKSKRAKSVMSLAKRLLAARVKLLKAMSNRMGPMSVESRKKDPFLEQLQVVNDGGVHMILAEFDADDVFNYVDGDRL